MLTLPAGRRSKYVVLALALVFFIGLASQAGKFEGIQKNESSSLLPGDAESVKALEAIQQLPGGELAPAVIVFEREGGLTEADRQRDQRDPHAAQRGPSRLVLEAQEPVFSENGAAALIVQPVQPGEGVGDKFETARPGDRDRAGESSDGLEVKLTGAAGYSTRRDQGLRRRQRPAAARGGEHRARPADRRSTARRSSG